jgi:hypothetical protein
MAVDDTHTFAFINIVNDHLIPSRHRAKDIVNGVVYMLPPVPVSMHVCILLGDGYKSMETSAAFVALAHLSQDHKRSEQNFRDVCIDVRLLDHLSVDESAYCVLHLEGAIVTDPRS